ncbi:MAG TPA: hypothetical protein VFI65_28790 [Streptosporangiaceae bacterium]|nr:hypothetical protein [Streptosporangiaceae bacterium]
MDTWAIQAAVHASLTSGFNYAPIPVVGTDSLNGFALGAGLAVLAFAATRVSQQLGPLRLPIKKVKPRKKRVSVKFSRVLADQGDEPQPTVEPHPGVDEIFWPQKRSADNSSGGYQSKHRLPGPAKPPPRERRAPRHAAPSTRFSAR